jgi:hypothetical protein
MVRCFIQALTRRQVIRFRPYIGASSRFARGIFAPRREESLPVRMIALAIGVWTAVTLGWIGSPWWAWMGGVALLCTGHAVSWRQSNSRIPIRAIIVGVGVIGSLALTPGVASQAAGGDWLPAAHFLLLYQAITSFELRSRSGLYASIGLSGAIVLFVSQHAVDSFFGIFLTGFATLVLAFFAVSFLVRPAPRRRGTMVRQPLLLRLVLVRRSKRRTGGIVGSLPSAPQESERHRLRSPCISASAPCHSTDRRVGGPGPERSGRRAGTPQRARQPRVG